MSTWTCKGAAAAAVLLLAGCDELAGLPSGPGAAPRVTRIALAEGDVVLAAPSGYCIDPRSVQRGRDGFAVIARCDTLGMGRTPAPRDLALITAATQPATTAAQPDARTIASAKPSARLAARRTIGGRPYLLLADPGHKVDGASPTHWRTAFVLNGQAVGLALYAGDGSDTLGPGGARLLAETAEATRAASADGS